MLSLSEDSMNSIGNSFEHISCEEIDKTLQALELLLSKAKTLEFRDSLEQLKSFLSKENHVQSDHLPVDQIYKDLTESLDKEADLDHNALYIVLGLGEGQAGLDYASDLSDLIKGQIAGFDKEKLREMCTFSKISYGNVDRKLEKGEYKTKREFEEEGYQIIKFYDNDSIQNEYCLDTDYKLEQHDVGYALTGSNSYNRDAGYIFIKDKEVTIAYHGTRDLNDVKEDLRASLAKLSFLSEDHRVHSGFYSLFKRSWPSVHKILQGHANDKGLAIKDLKINVTGHSMGGALASITALCLNKTEGTEDVHVATFGSPRVFYNDAAEVYNQCLGNKTVRVACQSDPVPCLPHGNAGMHYKHVGKPLKLETGKTLEYLEPHYHKIDTYYNLIQEVEQEKFKSDNNASKYRHIAYIFGLFYHAVLSNVDVGDKEFFEKVKQENKDIKLSEIPIQYDPNLEKKLKQKEQKLIQLQEELSSIQQSLDEETEELKGTKDQLAENKAELDEQISKVTRLNGTVEKLEETNAGLERKNSNLTNQLKKLEKAKTKLEEKVECAEKELKDARAQFRESEGGLREVKAQLEQENSDLSSQARELERKCEQTEVQLVASKQKLAKETSKVMQLSKESNEARAQLEKKKKEIGKLKDQVDQMTIQNNQLEGRLDDAKQGLIDKTDEVTRLTQVADTLNGRVAQLTTQNDQLEGQLNDARQSFADQIMQRENENNDLKTKLQEIENKSEVLEKSLQKQFESKNEELSEKFLKARTYSKRQGNYASVSFVLSGALAVGTSLTILHLAMCISLAVAALAFLTVGCYCSYKANTTFNNVEIENCSYRIAA
ncbi:lipase family protein [Wolbachia endosymbiont of Diaphorina citri]|jgi:Chromosome segregation ATPases|uniref:lipase family protein n=1 Tax=Wolbachia endosymbiont of Diaphorina citri TaxID=116598 RepID=UPI0003109DA5|nr:lipase family protein [Wolbachia endosymbiont of Diaphorina citri]